MNDKKPHFLEVFLPNLSSQRLEVPSKFNKHLRGITSGAISLIGPSGDKWHVDLIGNDDRLFFDDGWPTFVKDHSILCGDGLVFRYDGNSQLTVQIFDQTSCEKEEAFNATCSQESKNCNGNLGKKRERDKEVHFVDVVGGKKHKRTLSRAQIDLPAGNEEEGLIICSIGEVPTVLGLPCTSNTEWKASVVKPYSKAFRGTKAGKKKQNTAIDISISKFIESRAEDYVTSSSPYFVRVMTHTNIDGNGTMTVPLTFSSAHLPNYKTKVTLRNLNGDCWMINCLTTAKRSSTRFVFSGGWLAFVRENGIKIEDVCIFELVGELEMVVRILRLDVDGLEEISGCHSESAADITEDTGGDQLLNDSEQLTDFNMYDHGDHKEDVGIIPVSQHELTVELLQKSPSRSGQSPLSSTCEIYSDRNLMCNAERSILDETSRENEVVVFNEIIDNPALVEEAADYLTFTSPFPCFMKTMKDSSIGKKACLNVPGTFSAAHLLFRRSSIVLRNMKGNSWVVNAVRYGLRTKLLGGGWMSFILDNGVKVGDVCIFELIDEEVFQVRVFKGGHNAHKGQESTMSFRPDITQYTSGGQLLNDSEQLTDFNMYDHEDQKEDLEVIPASQHEVTVELLPKSPSRSDQSPLSRTRNAYSDMNLLSGAEEPIVDETGRDNEVLDFDENIDNPALVEDATECATFTSPFPNFMKTMVNSSYYTLLNRYNYEWMEAVQCMIQYGLEPPSLSQRFRLFTPNSLTLWCIFGLPAHSTGYVSRCIQDLNTYFTLFAQNVPRKFSAAHLPFHKSDIVLRNMEGNSWVVNGTSYGIHFKLCGGWMSFVLDNGVKVGDVFIFELVDEKVFQVRIFKGGRKGQECQISEVADDSTICSVLSHIEAYLDQVDEDVSCSSESADAGN